MHVKRFNHFSIHSLMVFLFPTFGLIYLSTFPALKRFASLKLYFKLESFYLAFKILHILLMRECNMLEFRVFNYDINSQIVYLII